MTTKIIEDEPEPRKITFTNEEVIEEDDIPLGIYPEFEERTGSSNPRVWFNMKYENWRDMNLDEIKTIMKEEFPYGKSFQTIFNHYKAYYDL